MLRSPQVDFEAVFHRKAELQEGVVKFNMKPKKGIAYLCEVCDLEYAPAAVARFLLETGGLDKRAVGEYLGEGDDFNKQVPQRSHALAKPRHELPRHVTNLPSRYFTRTSTA